MTKFGEPLFVNRKKVVATKQKAITRSGFVNDT
jgi:hypothetical protein